MHSALNIGFKNLMIEGDAKHKNNNSSYLSKRNGINYSNQLRGREREGKGWRQTDRVMTSKRNQVIDLLKQDASLTILPHLL